MDARSRASRGFAFITMETVSVAERCIKYLNGATLDGRVITVEKVTSLFTFCWKTCGSMLVFGFL